MTIQKLISRLKLFRRFVVGAWALAILVIASGVSASFFYFSKRSDLHTASVNYAETMRDAQYVRSLTNLYLSHPETKKYDEVRADIMRDLEAHPMSISYLNQLSIQDLPRDRVPLAMMEIQSLVDELMLQKTEQAISQSAQMENVTLSLIGVALMTLFLGIYVPYFLTKQLIDLSQKTKTQVSHSIAETVASWVKTQEHFGDEAFKNPKFWIEVTSIVVENYAPYWDSPGTQTVAEVAKLLRAEMRLVDKAQMSENDQKMSNDSGPNLKIA